MPTYAYRCTACEHAFDIHQGFSDASLTVCPQCDGRLRKVFSPVGVVFKGSGFYRTDARSSSSLPADKASATKDSKPSTTDSTTSTSSSTPSPTPAKQPATTAS
ncbi:MAG: FmdB family transcriptional regulator [Micrococcales bacterium]|nr:FmdB family transcriptional regulator [Micrococcales bacterium]MCL2666962.1 FmdB family transcriptional regulator [Micrococcales bacterium]